MTRTRCLPHLILLALSGGCGTISAPAPQPPIAPATTRVAAPPAPVAEAPLAVVETPVEPEKNPPGDIPDSQIFVHYTSAVDGYTVKVPEGWARTDIPNGVQWIDKLDGVKIVSMPATAAPTAENAVMTLVPALKTSGHAVEVGPVRAVTLPGGPAVRIDYHSNSEPNPVTDKKVRLEASNYYYFHAGKLVILSLWAPAGADNVDQWELMSKSLRWP